MRLKHHKWWRRSLCYLFQDIHEASSRSQGQTTSTFNRESQNSGQVSNRVSTEYRFRKSLSKIIGFYVGKFHTVVFWVTIRNFIHSEFYSWRCTSKRYESASHGSLRGHVVALEREKKKKLSHQIWRAFVKYNHHCCMLSFGWFPGVWIL